MILPWLRAVYEGGSGLPSRDERGYYERLQRELAGFGVEAQVLAVVTRSGLAERVPEWLMHWLRMRRTETVYVNLWISHVMKLILEAFDSAGISVIPLKGVHLAERIYEDPGARSTVDIDLLILGGQLAEACDLVRGLGFEEAPAQIPEHFHLSFCKRLPRSEIPLVVELHWDVLKPGTSSLRIADWWRDSLPLEPYRHVRMLSEGNTFYFLCLHAWRHNLNTPKHFLDIAESVRQWGNRLDLAALRRQAAADGTRKRLEWVMNTTVQHFPHLSGLLCLPWRLPRKVRWSYSGPEGHKVVHYTQYVQLWHSQYWIYDSPFAVWRAVREWLLPSPFSLRAELGEAAAGRPVLQSLGRLYRQRWLHLLRTFGKY